MIQKYKHEITLAALLITASIAMYYLYGLLLPFILGLALAFAVFPLIKRIQGLVRKRDIAISLFLLSLVAAFTLSVLFFAHYINRDFKRLNKSFSILVSQNEENIDRAGLKIKEYLGYIYDYETIEKDITARTDSLRKYVEDPQSSGLDIESIKSGISELSSLFSWGSDSKQDQQSGSGGRPSFSLVFILFTTLFYFVLILYQYDYFNSLRNKYLSKNLKSRWALFISDFDQSFTRYFKLRTRIILILCLIYLAAFIILDIPGFILLTLLIFLLSYVPYLQYIALIPLALGSLVVSVENGQSFLLIYGIVIGVFILASIIEEAILNPWIMEKNIGLNPVVMILGLSIWSYLLGLPGVILGIPMTSLFIIYLKRYVLVSEGNEINRISEENEIS